MTITIVKAVVGISTYPAVVPLAALEITSMKRIKDAYMNEDMDA